MRSLVLNQTILTILNQHFTQKGLIHQCNFGFMITRITYVSWSPVVWWRLSRLL